MIAAVVNAIAIIIGGTVGTLCGNRINERYTGGIMTVIALVTACIGIQGAANTKSFLVLVLSVVIGTFIGMLLRLDDRINSSGDWAKRKLSGTPLGKGPFGDALVTTTILFGVGTMTVVGSIRAGLNHDYSIIFTKSIMDFVSAIIFSSAMGSGVIFACIPVFIIQGSITLLASLAEPVLTPVILNEVSAAGGPIFLALAANILELRKERFKVGDMLPAIFLPVVLYPLIEMLGLL